MKLAFRPVPAPPALTGSERAADSAPGRRLAVPLVIALVNSPQSERGAQNMDVLARGEALAVLTGQQPCFPLPLGLSLLKAATAVALAEREERRLGFRVVPVFWSASDDSDFEEARGQTILRPGRKPLRVALAGELEKKGGFVGDLPLEHAYTELVALGGLPSGLDRWRPRPGEDLGTRECRIMADLFAPWGLICLDARQERLRDAAEEIFKRYARRRVQFTASVDDTGDTLEASWGRRPLRRGIGARALFFLKRRRRSLPHEEEYAERLDQRLRSDPISLSPNAALRPLVQDHVFPVLAAVLGPSEWDYHIQLRPAFDLMELPFPKAVPRLRLEQVGGWESELSDPSRHSSPLAAESHPMADPAFLVAAAAEHLEHWDAGRHGVLLYEGV